MMNFEDFKQDTASKLAKAIKDREDMPACTLLNFGNDELFIQKFDLLENKVRPILKQSGLGMGETLVIQLDRQDMYL